jgi:hypothetical protein
MQVKLKVADLAKLKIACDLEDIRIADEISSGNVSVVVLSVRKASQLFDLGITYMGVKDQITRLSNAKKPDEPKNVPLAVESTSKKK